jgi:hypothetical protein
LDGYPQWEQMQDKFARLLARIDMNEYDLAEMMGEKDGLE